MADFLSRVRNVTTGRPASDVVSEPKEPHVPPLIFDPPAAPSAPHPHPAPETAPAPAPSAAQPASADTDLLGIAPAVRRLAEFAAHAGTKTPLTIGILGQAGAGKTFALNRLLADVAAFAASAAHLQGSPFVSQIVVARVDASGSGEPATRIAAALFDALHRPGPDGRTYPALAEEAADAVTDPVEAARLARERLADARRRLDSDREALREMNSRRARLAESILYETAGSRIDAHARVNRASIESRLRGFGFVAGDPIATYKDLVRDIAEKGGVGGRIRAFLRALWGFRGQTRLIVLAIFFFLVAFGLGEAQATRATWLGWLAKQESLKTAATWIEANIGWLAMAKQAAIWAGILALLLNVLRAIRFLMPIFRGVSLFKADVETRNRDLDTLIANQTQLVDDLAGEIEPLSKRAAEAERRAAAAASSEAQQQTAKSPFGSGEVKQAAAFITALGAAATANDARAPRRILVAFDNLDALSGSAASHFMSQAQELLVQPAYVTVLTAGDAGADAVSRFVEIPLRLASAFDPNRVGNLVRAMLGLGATPPVPQTAVDASKSLLGSGPNGVEATLLETLAPIAASTPRDVKRFVSAYTIARGGFEHHGALAVALAFQSGGHESEREALDKALDGAPDGEAVTAVDSPRVNFALDAARTAQGSSVTAGQLRAARTVAALWSFKN